MKKVFGWLVLGTFLAVSGLQAAAPADVPVHKTVKKRVKKGKKHGKRKVVARKASKRKIKA